MPISITPDLILTFAGRNWPHEEHIEPGTINPTGEEAKGICRRCGIGDSLFNAPF
jgi:hypothetical protein